MEEAGAVEEEEGKLARQTEQKMLLVDSDCEKLSWGPLSWHVNTRFKTKVIL